MDGGGRVRRERDESNAGSSCERAQQPGPINHTCWGSLRSPNLRHLSRQSRIQHRQPLRQAVDVVDHHIALRSKMRAT